MHGGRPGRRRRPRRRRRGPRRAAGRAVGVLTEEFDWLGGQLTSQAVPPDEHTWVEQFGVTASYRRSARGSATTTVRHYPLTAGGPGVARAQSGRRPCQPALSRAAGRVAVLEAMLAPYRGHRPADGPASRTGRSRADTDGDRVTAVTVRAPRTGERAHGHSAVRPRRDRDRRAAAADRHRVRDRLRGAGRHRRAERAGRRRSRSTCRRSRSASRSTTSTATTPIDRPADYAFWRDYQPPFWGDRLLSFRAPDPRTLAYRADASPRTRTTTRGGLADQRDDDGDRNLWTSAGSRPAGTSRRGVRQRHLPGQLAADRLLRGPGLRRAGREPSTYRRAGAVSLLLTGCRPRRRVPTAARAARAAAARRRHRYADGLAQAPYIRESRRSGPSTRSSSRTCRSPSGRARARSQYADTSGSACTASTCTRRPAATTTSTWPPARSRSPSEPCIPRGWRTCCPRQEYRHHPHHQRLLPPAPGRVEHRRGGRARSPPSAWTAA